MTCELPSSSSFINIHIHQLYSQITNNTTLSITVIFSSNCTSIYLSNNLKSSCLPNKLKCPVLVSIFYIATAIAIASSIRAPTDNITERSSSNASSRSSSSSSHSFLELTPPLSTTASHTFLELTHTATKPVKKVSHQSTNSEDATRLTLLRARMN